MEKHDSSLVFFFLSKAEVKTCDGCYIKDRKWKQEAQLLSSCSTNINSRMRDCENMSCQDINVKSNKQTNTLNPASSPPTNTSVRQQAVKQTLGAVKLFYSS